MKVRCHLDDSRSYFYLKISHVTLTIQEVVYDRITQNLPKYIIKVVVEVSELFVMFYLYVSQYKVNHIMLQN